MEGDRDNLAHRQRTGLDERDSLMSDLDYREYDPAPPLAPFVRCVWTLRAAAGAVGAQPIVPDGCVELVFHRGDPFRRLTSGGTSTQARALLVGALTAPVVVEPTGAADVVGIRLHPWSGHRTTGIPAGVLSDIEPLHDIAPSVAGEIQRLVDSEDERTLVPQMMRLLERRVLALRPPDPALRALVEQVMRSPALPGVREMASRLGRSTRWVQRAFASTVGINPKMLARIARVQRALRMTRRDTRSSWSMIAAEAGYFDQSHLVRDFRQFVGCTPSQFDPRAMRITDVFVER